MAKASASQTNILAMNTKPQSPETTIIAPARYADLIGQINKHIGEFNAFLSDKYRLTIIDPENPATYSNHIQGMPWGQQKYPACQNTPGVYILCGPSEQDPARLSAYVGKASCSRFIGHRLWSHLHASYLAAKRQGVAFQGVYRYGRHPNSFLIEVILAVSTPTPPSMAAALEEYIINAGLPGVQLFNANGRSPEKAAQNIVS